MTCKIVVVVSLTLISVCVAEMLPALHQIQPSLNQEYQAKSTMSFYRDDIPLEYKYSAVHTYTTKRPVENFKQQGNYYQMAPEAVDFRSIQYAPLIKSGEKRLQSGMFNKVSLYSPHIMNSEGVHTSKFISTPKRERKPLEPQLEPNPSDVLPPLQHLDYIPGHNIEVLRSVNRSPGHNAVYRGNIDNNNKAPVDAQKKVLNQFVIYQPDTSSRYHWPSSTEQITNPATPPATTTTTTTKTTITNLPKAPYVPNPYSYVPRSNTVQNADFAPVKQQLQRTPYTKMHALLLNVARAYNMALTPNKSLHAGANISVLRNSSPNSQTYIKIPSLSQLPLGEQRTLMYPIQKNMHFAIHSA